MLITKIHESRTTSTGKPQQIVSVDNNPQKLTFWGNTLIEGQNFVGEIVPPNDPKYNPTLREAKTSARTGNFASKTKDMEKIMDKKQEGVKASQDTKWEHITRSGSITNGTNLTIAMLDHKIYEQSGMISNQALNVDEVRSLLKDNIKFFEEMYNSPFI